MNLLPLLQGRDSFNAGTTIHPGTQFNSIIRCERTNWSNWILLGSMDSRGIVKGFSGQYAIVTELDLGEETALRERTSFYWS